MMYEDKPLKNIIQYKMNRKIIDECAQKLKLMKNLGVFQGVTYVEVTLK